MVKGLGLGGVERLLSESIPYLDRDRFEYEVAYFTPWKDDVVPSFLDAGLSVHCLDITSDISGTGVSKVRSLIRNGRYDLIHTHSPLPSTIVRVVSPGATLVHTEHSLPGSRNRLTRLANRVTYPLCDVVISVSRVVGRAVTRGWPAPRDSRVIYGGIDPRAVSGTARADVEKTRAALGIPPGGLVVGNVAHLRHQKGHEVWLETARAVSAELPQTTFVIVGREKEAGYQDTLERRAAALGIDTNVRFVGFQPDPYPYVASFDVFLMASEFEGFPISLVEAMALGRPVVATDVGGVAEALGPEPTGLLARPGDTRALAAHVTELLRDEGKRLELGARARDRAIEEFSIARMVGHVESVYDELLGT
ncbi:MAG: glycosyltransferase [Acidimicrobiia bacterium]|jgi:glycosyltransferase involved in cell wall biosynthesis